MQAAAMVVRPGARRTAAATAAWPTGNHHSSPPKQGEAYQTILSVVVAVVAVVAVVVAVLAVLAVIRNCDLLRSLHFLVAATATVAVAMAMAARVKAKRVVVAVRVARTMWWRLQGGQRT